jgi:hypothetical protein
MKLLFTLLLLVLIASLLLAGSYKAEVSTAAEVSITKPVDANFGYEIEPVELTKDSTSTLPGFILYNRFPLNAIVTVDSVVTPNTGLTVAPATFVVGTGGGVPISLTYTGTEIGTYTVIYSVSGEVISGLDGGGTHVDLTFSAQVTVKNE